MRIKHLPFVFLGVLLLLSSCKSEFEKIRTSGDPQLLLTKANEYFESEEYQRAQTLYELIISSFRGKKEAEELYFKYAYTYYNLGQFVLASYYFKNFSQTFGGSALREEADYMVAYSNYRLSPTFRLDQSYTDKAIDAFQLFINTYPESPRVAECNRLIDELRSKMERKAFDSGNLYFNLRQYQASIRTFDNMLKDFPETPNAEEVRYMIIRASYLLAENSFVEKQEERYREALNRAAEYLERFPDSRYTKDISNIFDNSQKKLNQLENVRHKDQSARAGS